MTNAGSPRRLAAPRDALRLLTECLVLAFVYDESQRRFCFVCDYPDKTAGSDRAFAAFVFDGVTSFIRESGNLSRFNRFVRAYRAMDNETPIVVQNIRTNEHEKKSRVECWFGPNFGGIRFTYNSVAAFVRDAKVRQVGGSFVYFDLASGKEFDFLLPFPDYAGPSVMQSDSVQT